MKLSVSLSDDELAMLDQAVVQYSLPSRSAAVQKAIRLLDGTHLAAEYAEAFAEWEIHPANTAWDGATADGIADETW